MSAVSALGFISMQFVSDMAELLATHRKLQACATAHGFELQKVYVEQSGPPSAAFDLLGALMETAGQPVLVPTLLHLVVLGNPTTIRDHLRQSGHDVVIVNKPVERAC